MRIQVKKRRESLRIQIHNTAQKPKIHLTLMCTGTTRINQINSEPNPVSFQQLYIPVSQPHGAGSIYRYLLFATPTSTF